MSLGCSSSVIASWTSQAQLFHEEASSPSASSVNLWICVQIRYRNWYSPLPRPIVVVQAGLSGLTGGDCTSQPPSTVDPSMTDWAATAVQGFACHGPPACTEGGARRVGCGQCSVRRLQPVDVYVYMSIPQPAKPRHLRSWTPDRSGCEAGHDVQTGSPQPVLCWSFSKHFPVQEGSCICRGDWC